MSRDYTTENSPKWQLVELLQKYPLDSPPDVVQIMGVTNETRKVVITEDFFARLRAERGIKTPEKLAINYTDGGRVGAGFIHEKKDCAVRALALLKGWTYAEAHAFWAKHGRKPGKGVVWVEGIKDARVERVLEIEGGSVAKVLAELPKVGRFVIRVPGHVFAVVDGVPQDTFRPKARGHVRGVYRNIENIA